MIKSILGITWTTAFLSAEATSTTLDPKKKKKKKKVKEEVKEELSPRQVDRVRIEHTHRDCFGRPPDKRCCCKRTSLNHL